MSLLLDSEKPGGLGSSTRGALSLSVKSIAHGLPIASRGPLAAGPALSLVAYLPSSMLHPGKYELVSKAGTYSKLADLLALNPGPRLTPRAPSRIWSCLGI